MLWANSSQIQLKFQYDASKINFHIRTSFLPYLVPDPNRERAKKQEISPYYSHQLHLKKGGSHKNEQVIDLTFTYMNSMSGNYRVCEILTKPPRVHVHVSLIEVFA